MDHTHFWKFLKAHSDRETYLYTARPFLLPPRFYDWCEVMSNFRFCSFVHFYVGCFKCPSHGMKQVFFSFGVNESERILLTSNFLPADKFIFDKRFVSPLGGTWSFGIRKDKHYGEGNRQRRVVGNVYRCTDKRPTPPDIESDGNKRVG